MKTTLAQILKETGKEKPKSVAEAALERVQVAQDAADVSLLKHVASFYEPGSEFYQMGFVDFDVAMDGGIRPGELITVSARTGEGKTTFCQNLTVHFHNIGVKTLWFSFEMSPWYLNQKFVKMGAPEDLSTFSPQELVASNIEFIERKVRAAKEIYDCKVVFIDHLHYLMPLNDAQNMSFQVGWIVRQLKLMATKYNVVIFLIAHTKKIYQDEELNLSSIRDSSLIAQESDYVFLIERVRQKKEKKKFMTETHQAMETPFTNQSKIHLAKNRRTGQNVMKTFNVENNTYTPLSEVEEYKDELESLFTR